MIHWFASVASDQVALGNAGLVIFTMHEDVITALVFWRATLCNLIVPDSTSHKDRSTPTITPR